MLKNLFNVGLFVLILSSCRNVSVPAVSEIATNTYTPGRVVWHDLATPDPAKAKLFYSQVFNWQFTDIESGGTVYSVAKNNGKPIGLITLMAKGNGNTAEWVGSISVENVKATIENARQKGAKIIKEPTELNGRGTTAFFTDPQGATIGIVKAIKGDPSPAKAEIGSWLGQELWSDNTTASTTFYSELIGYETKNVNDNDIPYTIFKKGDMICAGLMKNPVSGVRSHWLPYIRVENVDTVIAKAKNAGARVLLAPNKVVRNGKVAVMLDPTGAPLAIQEYN